MHPNAFLRTFWQTQFKPEVFVAMSFEDAYKQRFDEVFAPAIRSILVRGVQLRPNRVDLSRSGDSILTDIMDGICHAELILADVSSVGRDSVTGRAYRNANVLYEVGLALACRQPSEVVLVKDDHDQFLFDVSTVPHMTLDFTDAESARSQITEALVGRMKERSLVGDARAVRASATLSTGERTILKMFAPYGLGQTFWMKQESLASSLPLARLLDKQLILAAGVTDSGSGTFIWTRLGYAVAKDVAEQDPVITESPDVEGSEDPSSEDTESSDER